MGEYQPGEVVNGFVLRGGLTWEPILGQTCFICYRPLPPPRSSKTRWWFGAPSERCTGRDRTSCWPTFLARVGWAPSVERVPVFLQRKALALYFENVEDLLLPYANRAKAQGRVISDAEMTEVHSRAWQRSVNDMSRLVRRPL